MLDVHDRMHARPRGARAGWTARSRRCPTPRRDRRAPRTAGLGLTQPELAVRARLQQDHALRGAAGVRPARRIPALDGELERYFPAPLPERFGDVMQRHRLRREIIATRVTNDLSTARARRSCSACARTPARRRPTSRAPRWSRATCSTCARCGRRSRRSTAPVAADVQSEMLLSSRRLVERATRWLLRSRPRPLDIAAEVERFGAGARGGRGRAAGRARGVRAARRWRERVAGLTEAGVPEALAARVAAQGALFSALDIVEVAGATERARRGGRGAALRARRQPAACTGCATRSRCCRATTAGQAMARAALRDDLFSLHAELTRDGAALRRRSTRWIEANRAAVERAQEILGEIRSGGTFDLTTLPVALREVRNLIGPRVRYVDHALRRGTHAAVKETDGEEGHDWQGTQTLLLTTTGRKSGEPRELPLIYGKSRRRLPDRRLQGRGRRAARLVPEPQGRPRGRGAGQGRPLQGAARVTPRRRRRPEMWKTMTAEWPAYDDYQKKTDREIPIVVLERD